MPFQVLNSLLIHFLLLPLFLPILILMFLFFLLLILLPQFGDWPNAITLALIWRQARPEIP